MSEQHFGVGVQTASFLQFRISEHTLSSLKFALPFLQIDVVKNHVITLQTFMLVVLLLIDDIGFFFK